VAKYIFIKKFLSPEKICLSSRGDLRNLLNSKVRFLKFGVVLSENRKLKKFWLYELTRPAFEDWLENEPAPVMVIGVGSIEQHGPHLPLGTDSLTARKFIYEVAKKTNSLAFSLACLVLALTTWVSEGPSHSEKRL
jgi:hypothetical protein